MQAQLQTMSYVISMDILVIFIVLRKQNSKGFDSFNFLEIDEMYFANASGSNLHNGIQYTDDH